MAKTHRPISSQIPRWRNLVLANRKMREKMYVQKQCMWEPISGTIEAKRYVIRDAQLQGHQTWKVLKKRKQNSQCQLSSQEQ